jgi:hypothetical protein
MRNTKRPKKKNGPVIWAKAVLSREYLEKIADPHKQADIFEEMFTGEKSADSFRELCEDSKSYPRKSLPFLPASEKISVTKSLIAKILTSLIQRLAALDCSLEKSDSQRGG